MPHRNVAGLVVAVLTTAALVACSSQSPAAPSTPAVVASNAMPEDVGPLDAQAVEGTYTLNLATTTGQIVSSLPVTGTGFPSELLLWAQVSGPGGLAQRGSVIFQACRRRGDYTLSADCESGAGNWTHVSTQELTGCGPFAPQTGNACITFGGQGHPNTIGFRYKFIGKGGDIANGESMSKDMTWVIAVQ